MIINIILKLAYNENYYHLLLLYLYKNVLFQNKTYMQLSCIFINNQIIYKH